MIMNRDLRKSGGGGGGGSNDLASNPSSGGDYYLKKVDDDDCTSLIDPSLSQSYGYSNSFPSLNLNSHYNDNTNNNSNNNNNSRLQQQQYSNTKDSLFDLQDTAFMFQNSSHQAIEYGRGGGGGGGSDNSLGRGKKRKIKSLGSLDHSNGSDDNLVFLDTTASGIFPSASNGSVGFAANNQMLKKRFVWPQSLHQDFIGAVFDVGLRYATPRDVLSFMNTPIGSGGGGGGAVGYPQLSQDLLKSQILKFQLFRDQRFFPRSCFYDLENSELNDQLLNPPPSGNINEHYHSNSNFIEQSINYGDSLTRSSQIHSVAPPQTIQHSSTKSAPTASTNTSSTSYDADSRQLCDKLEKECKELMKVINNQFIKVDFLMKLENDMAHEMNELVQKQNEQKHYITTQLYQILDTLPNSQTFSMLGESIRDNLPVAVTSQVINNSHRTTGIAEFSVQGRTNNNYLSSHETTDNRSSHELGVNADNSDSSLAEILAAKYRSIMEMKDHIKLHRVLLQKHDSQIHGHNVSVESQGSIVIHNNPPASVEYEFHGSNANAVDNSSSSDLLIDNAFPHQINSTHRPDSPSDLMTKWLDDNDDDLFSFLIDNNN